MSYIKNSGRERKLVKFNVCVDYNSRISSVSEREERLKIRLEKLAVNISKLMGGKNEKPRRGVSHEKLWLDLYFVYRKH